MSAVQPVVVVGTGPSGLAACRALAESGLAVLWLEAGGEPPPPPRHRPERLAAARLGSPDGWRTLLGADLRAARPADLRSPKLRLAVDDGFTHAFTRDNVAAAHGFTAIGTLAAGGLGRLWGAFCPAWTKEELGGLDLDESYRRVAAWMALSGDAQGPLAPWLGDGLPLAPSLPLSRLFTPIWEKAPRTAASGFTLDRVRLAVDPAVCDGCGACLWGCGASAIWDGAAERARLAALPQVELRRGVAVERLEAGSDGHGHVLLCRDRDANRFTLEADTVVLATGALATTRLVLDRLGQLGKEVRLETTPALSVALLAPHRLGTALPRRVHGMAQLCFRQDMAGGEAAFGMLYDAAALPAPDLAQALPFSRVGAAVAARLLMPAMAICFLYLPGRYSDNRLRVDRVDGLPRLTLSGGTIDAFRPAARTVLRRVGRALRPLGLWALPGSARPSPPGAECHYGASLAQFAATGEVAPGLFAADASVLPAMAAKHHTFTAMANADRIARRLAATLTGSA